MFDEELFDDSVAENERKNLVQLIVLVQHYHLNEHLT